MSRITLEMDTQDYINLLQKRREEIEPRGWTIPEGVWEVLIDYIEESEEVDDVDPTYIVDKIAVNGDYGPAEDYLDIEAIIKRIKITLGEESEEFDDELREAVREMAEDYVLQHGFFTYDEPESEFDIGICVSL